MKLKRTPKELRALTLVELLVAVAVIAITGLTLLAQNMSTNPRMQSAQCMSNLKQIGLAFRVWEGDYGNRYPMCVPKDKGGSLECGAGPEMFMSFRVMSNELNNAAILHCPADDREPPGGFATLGNNNLSYFVGLDADESRRGMFLSGDRNLATNGVDVVPGLVLLTPDLSVGWSATMHNGRGNFGLADGSVQTGSGGTLQAYLSRTGTNVNRLAVP
jgi:prepilin-type processing-associated H-X9-DG protein